jgi:chromosome segregation ATPase
MSTAVARPKRSDRPVSAPDPSTLSLSELEAELRRTEKRIDEVRAQRNAARKEADEVEDAYISGALDDPSVAVAARQKKNEIQNRLVTLLSRRQALREEITSARRDDDRDAEMDATLNALVKRTHEIEAIRQQHDAAFTEAVAALDDALDAMMEALSAWKQKARTFRQEAGQLEASVLSNDRKNPDAAAFLQQLQERGADLQAVVTARSGVAWPRDMYKVAPTYWLPVKGPVADTVESLLRERMRKEHGRTLQGGR